jgi:hypothetical protein
MQVRNAIELPYKLVEDTAEGGLVIKPALTYAHVCSRMLTYAHVCSHMLTYAGVC